MMGYAVIDNFLPDIDEVEDYLRLQDFRGMTNPVDGVHYPDITVDLPPGIVRSVERKLGCEIDAKTMFARLTCERTATAPHQAHNDASMGEYTLILYMQDGPGGTDFVRHKELGMETGPAHPLEVEVWQRDTNVYDAWEVVQSIPMKRNRALVFRSERMHRAEPVDGFGTGPEDGRIVLTIFFDRKE